MTSETDVDVSALSPAQREALQQLTDMTNQQVRDALPLLERSQWNVQIAITKFFDGDGPDLVAEARAAQSAIPRSAAVYENLHESLLASSSRTWRASRPRTDPAPRVVPPPPSVYRAPFFLAILFAPFQTGYRVLSGLLRVVFYSLSFLPAPFRPRAVTGSIRKGLRDSNGRRMLLPKDTADRFRREFEETYGPHDLPFFEGSHAKALDAAKRDVKFLLLVLISPEHDDTEVFIRETLLSPDVVGFLNDPANNMLLWAGNILDSEAYQVANEYMCTKYPFSCLVSLTPKEGSTRMGIIKRLTGPMPPEAYMAGMQSAMTKYAPDLEGVRASRDAQAETRNLRTEQDSAYERSLARDRERARQRREAEEAAAAAERLARGRAVEAERQEAARQRWRRWRATTLASEPDAHDKTAVRLALKMPASSGAGRVVRRFAPSTPLEELYAFVECYDMLHAASGDEKVAKPDGYEHEYAFQIASPMPREVFEPSKTLSIKEKLGRGGNVIVEEVSPDDEVE